MKTIVLDGSRMTTIQGAHEELSRKLSLPAYYGRNLDALWDILSCIHDPISITMEHAPQMLNALDSYGASLLRVFFDAAAENPSVEFTLHDETQNDVSA